MPRIRKTSEKEEETKPVRKTRQTVLISDSPVRRSTRIKHVVDSSPELEKSVTSKREFRKKNPNPDKYPTPARVLRNRSPSNDIENSPQATRKLRKRASPEITNIADNTTRSTRYSRRNKLSESEDQSSPPPLTRKTRGKSITDEDDSVSKKKASSKSRKRVVSVPVESSLLEEDKTDYDEPLEKSIVEETDDSIIIVDEVNSIKSVVKKKEKVNAMEKNLMKRLMSHKLNFSSNDSQQEMKNDSSIKKEKSLIDLELSKNENKEKSIEEEYFCEPMEVDTTILNLTNDATKNQNVDNTEKIDVPERMDRNFKPRNSMIETASEKHLITKSRYSLGNKIPNKIVIDEIKNRRQEEKNNKTQKSTENLESKSVEPDEKSEKKRESFEKRQSTEKRKSILNNSVKNSLSKSPSFHLLVTPDKEEFLKSNKEKISKSTERNLLKSREKIDRKRKRRSSDDYDTSNNFELTMYEYDSMTDERDLNASKNDKSIRNATLEEEIVPDSEEEKDEKESEEIIESDSKFLDKILKTSKSKSLGGSEIVSKKTRGFKSLDKMSLETINSFDGKREISELTSTEEGQNNLNKSKEKSLLADEEESSGEETVETVNISRKSQGGTKTPTPRKRLSNHESSKDGKSLLADEEESSGEETMETVKNSRKSQSGSKTPTPRKRLSNHESTKNGNSLLDEEESSDQETMETVKNSRKSQGASKTPTPRKRLSNVESTKDGKSVDEEESSGEETMETVKNSRKSQGESKTPTSRKRLSNIESTKDGNSLLDEEESSDQETMETVKSTRRSQNKTPTTKKRSSNVESSKKSSSRGKLNETGDSVSRIPTFMFSQTSESEETCEDASRSMDSDIAREYNLSGKSDLQYSDDDVPGDNCRASETEHSDSEDEGSDLADFIADDDEESEDSETEHYEESEANISKKGTKKGTIEIVDEEDEEEESDDDETEAHREEVGNKEGDHQESDTEEDDNEEREEVNNKEANDDDESDESAFANDLKSSLQLYKSKLPKKGKDDEKEKTNIPLENKEEKVSKSESEEEETSSDETESKKNLPLSSPVLSKSRSDRSLSDEEEKTRKHKESPTLEKSLVETKRKKKSKREFKSTAAKVPVASSTHYELSDADDEPETLSFAEGLLRAADEMKKKAQSIKEGIKGKEERKKKKKTNENNMRKTKSDDMKRLPDDVLQDLEDVPRPNKRQKMLKKENHDSPSRGIQPRPGSSTRRPILNSVSSFGSTTEFEIVNLQKEKKQKTQSSLAMKWFKQRMLARNARQPISVYLNQQKKRRAANKEYHSN